MNDDRTIGTREWSDSYVKLISETEENTISWRFLISQNEKKVRLYERYSDENAFKNHLNRIFAEGRIFKRSSEILQTSTHSKV